MKSFTVIVVSHVDLRAHRNANELINIKDFQAWLEPHHECKFTIKGNESTILKMQSAVQRHARKYYKFYGLKEEGFFDIYPLARSGTYFDHIYRLSERQSWNPSRCTKNFIFVSPSLMKSLSYSIQIAPRYNLLIIKFHNEITDTLDFVGTVPFFENELVSTRLRHIRKLCLTDNQPLQLLDVVTKSQFYLVDPSKTFKEQKLRTGSILIVQYWNEETSLKVEASRRLQKGLLFRPYMTHIYDKYATNGGVNPIVGSGLYEQAKDEKYTDVVLVSAKVDGVDQLRLGAHRMILATIPRFKTTFECGMKEGLCSSSIIELEAPPWTTHDALKDFHEYIYLRDAAVLSPESSASIERLIELYRLADFYCVEELLEKVALRIMAKYSYLTPENSLELLELLNNSVGLSQREDLERLVFRYMRGNFSLIGRCQQFGDMFGTDLYEKIVDAIAEVQSEPEEYDECEEYEEYAE